MTIVTITTDCLGSAVVVAFGNQIRCDYTAIITLTTLSLREFFFAKKAFSFAGVGLEFGEDFEFIVTDNGILSESFHYTCDAIVKSVHEQEFQIGTIVKHPQYLVFGHCSGPM